MGGHPSSNPCTLLISNPGMGWLNFQRQNSLSSLWSLFHTLREGGGGTSRGGQVLHDDGRLTVLPLLVVQRRQVDPLVRHRQSSVEEPGWAAGPSPGAESLSPSLRVNQCCAWCTCSTGGEKSGLDKIGQQNPPHAFLQTVLVEVSKFFR